MNKDTHPLKLVKNTERVRYERYTQCNVNNYNNSLTLCVQGLQYMVKIKENIIHIFIIINYNEMYSKSVISLTHCVQQ